MATSHMHIENYLQKELYQEVKHNEAIFDFIQDSSLDGLWYWDLEHPEHRWMNAKFWETLGYDAVTKPHLASVWQDIIHADDLNLALDNFRKHCENFQHPYDQVVRYRHRDGSTVWIRCRGMAIRDASGKPVRMLGAHTDVTDLKSKEAQLQSTIKRFESILNNQSTFVLRTDIEGRYTYANEHFYHVFHFDNTDVLGKSSLLTIVPEDHQRCKEVVSLCMKSPGVPHQVTLRKPTKFGKIIFTQWEFVCVLDDHGIPSEIQCVGVDITSRIEAESELEARTQELEGFFTTALDLLCIANLDGFFLKLNKSWEAVLGYTVEMLAGKRFLDFVHPDDVQATLGAMSDLNNGEQVLDFTNRYRRHDGTYAVIEWRSVVKGTIIYAAARDITSRIQQESKIRESELLLRSFYDNAPMMMGIVEIVGDDIIHIRDNSLSLQFFGKTADQLQNKRSSELGTPKDVISNWISYYKSSEETGLPCKFEYGHTAGKELIFLSVITSFIGATPDGRKRYAYIVNDVTAQKRAEAELKESELRYAQLVSASPVGVFEVRISPGGVTRFTFVSSKWEEIAGLTFEEVSADPMAPMRTLHPDDYRGFETLNHLSTAEGKPFYWEGRKIINGKLRHILIQANNHKTEDGTIVINGIESDITERKEAELLLKKTKNELEIKTRELDITLDSSGIGLWEIDLRTGELFWDKHLRKRFGYTNEPLTYETWKRHVHKNDIERVDAHFQSFLRGERNYEADYRVVSFDGTVRYEHSKAIQLYDQDGVAVKVSGISMDVTYKKEIEQELERTSLVLRQTNSLARVGGCVYDLEKQKLYYTDALREIMEVSANYEPDLTAHLNHYKEGEHRENIMRAMDNAISFGAGWDQERQLITAKGSEIWVRVIGKPEFKDGKCIRLFGAVQDISERKQAEEKIIAAQKNAEAASRAKSEFLSNMSHEIRTPLNGVIGFADLLMKTNLDTSQMEYMSTLHQSANSLLDIINDILDFSKIEAGKLELHTEQTDIHDLIDQAVEIIKFLAHKKQLELLIRIDKNLPRYVWIDRIRIRQILVNLLSNAIKFTQHGEIELKIERLTSDAGGESMIRFAVRDTGIGIDPKNQKRIFEAFSQEDSSVSKKFGGTGLGLTISNELLGLMASGLKLQSKVGEGSTFSFDLRLKTLDGPSEEFTGLAAIRHVLVVDDHEKNRYILNEMFSESNILVTEAKSGIEALLLLERGNLFDAIILDYNMPLLNGLETARSITRLMKTKALAPIILLYTSDDDDAIAKGCEELEIKHCLVKPVKKEQLFRALSTSRPKESTPEIATAEGSLVENLTILVADDNDTNLLLARTILRRISPSVNVIEARNGVEAVDLFSKHKPDLVFMDIQMPKMTGYESAQRIRSMSLDTPIIALTAATVKGERERCIEAGMNDYLTKPFVSASLKAVLTKWIKSTPELAKTPDLVHFDPTQLHSNLGHNKALINEILLLGISEMENCLNDITTSDGQDYPRIMRLAHKLKGSALNLSCPALSELSSQLENVAAAEMEISVLVLQVEKEVSLVKSLLKKQLL